ncbi:TRAM domain-containing protein, partial [Salibacter sp.]|uniref:TRAM domain-containing protein n=1 Tax=Salibacter sp. TaxID=2010995 RepID=UPI00286FD356
TMEDDVPEEVKHERAEAIMELQSGISHDLNQKFVGQTMKVLIDKVEGDHFVGRTEYDSPEVDNEVLITTKDNFLRVGDFANIKIDYAEHYDLYGSPVG